MQKVLWQFTHGVALEFLVEELSQYPFWAAKVVTVVDNTYRQNLNILTAVVRFFENTYERGGIRAFFEVCIEYIRAHGMNRFALIYPSFHRLVAVSCRFPYS